MTLFAADTIGLQYPGRAGPVFHDLSLTIRKGESLGLSGPSGMGKTSLMRVIAGLERPTSGRIPIRPRRIGMAFAEPRLLPRLSAMENLSFIAPKARAEGRAMLTALKMAALQDASADSLSKGQAQRVALIRALLIRPEILLLDEALGGLDMATWQNARDLILAKRDRDGFALVEISHDPARRIMPEARAISFT
ncbi:ATP-binding cassette domain-containing protein [Rhodovulum sulfidophilum]|uniref:ATP-binding cassette domain-containing protein n=1 Tax=Rhodovulum sulfidophilum TaxID=35806 RepID=UPI0019225E60|nr:ATP-binding cassette domain-containing protein [Rhodovulum sulfidophilum]MBL3562381.1 ATP-binding cassette domain-containing protein [Rhodovulum sulfidophilum]